MAYDAGTVKGELDLDAAKFIAELKRVETRLDKVEKEAGQAREGTKSFGSTLAKVAVGVGAAVVSFLALRAALRGIVGGLKKASADAAEFETVVRKLSISLGQAGVKGVADFVEEMKEFASGVQDATAFSDGFILETSQLLTVLGVSQDKLQDYTRAVLDYSAATGQDAVNAARQFGKTFGGTLGELAESLPALKVLTQEQLKMGAAFEFAGKAFGGFAEDLADTTEALSARLENTVGDFSKQVGAIINPFLNELKRQAITVVKEMTTAAQANRKQFAQLFKDFVLGVLDAIPAAIDAISSLRVAFTEAAASFSKLGPGLVGTFTQMTLSAAETHLAINKLFAKLGDKGAQESLAALNERVAGLRGTVDEAAAAYGAIVREAEASVVAAKKQGAALKSTLLPILERARQKIEDINTEFAKGEDRAEGLGDKVGKAASSTKGLAAAAEKVGEKLASATREARELDSAVSGAASSIASVGQSLSESLGRAGGRRAGLDLSDPFSALQALESARATQQQAGFSSYTFVRRAAANVTGQVQAAAQAQLDIAFSQFTSDLVSELNRAGVFNPTERQSFISERVSEAQRLGVLPTTRTAFAVGAVGSIG